MKIRSKLALATVLSVLLLVMPAVLLIYSLASSRLLRDEGLRLHADTGAIVIAAEEQLRDGEDRLRMLANAIDIDHRRVPATDLAAPRDNAGSAILSHFTPPGAVPGAAEQQLLDSARRVLGTYTDARNRLYVSTWLITAGESMLAVDSDRDASAGTAIATRQRALQQKLAMSTPERNPDRSVRWTGVTLDPATGRQQVSRVLPLYIDGRWAGAVGQDLTLDGLTSLFARPTDASVAVRHLLVDAGGELLLAGPWAASGQTGTQQGDLVASTDLQQLLSATTSAATQPMTVRLRGQSYLATAYPLHSGVNWRYIRLLPIDAVLAPVRSLVRLGTGALALMLLMTGVVVALVAHRVLVRPLLQFANIARAYGSGQTHVRAGARGSDEITELARGFDAMADGLERSQLELRQREAHYRSVVNSVREVIFQMSAQGRWLFLSHPWQLLTSYTEHDSLGRSVFEFVAVEDVQDLRLRLEALIKGDIDTCHCEFRVLTRSGERVWVEMIAQSAVDADGETVYSGTLDDVSERHYQQEVSALLRRAEEFVNDGFNVDQLLQYFCERLAWLFAAPLVIAAVNRDQRISIVGRSDSEAEFLRTIGGVRTTNPELQLFQQVFHDNSTIAWRSEQVTDSEWSRSAKRAGIGTVVAVPMIIKDDLSALLALHIRAGVTLSHDRAMRFEALCDRIGEALRRAEGLQWLRLQRTALESVANGIMIVDTDQEIIWVNPAMEALSGYTREEIIGRSPRLLSGGAAPGAQNTELVEAMRNGGTWTGEVVNRRKDGTQYTVHHTVTALTDAAGRPTHFVAVLADITALKNAEARMQHMATHDALTGLSNRVLFRERLKEAFSLASRSGQSVGVLLLDLDRFKTINDTLGHMRADELLQSVAGRLHRCLREHDTVARLGGDEFTILLPELDNTEHAALVAGKILQSLNEPFEVAGHTMTITTSIGISIYPDDGIDIDEILQRADAAMYQSKALGRNTYQFYTRAIHERSMQRLRIEKELRRGLEQNEFTLLFQPIADTRSGTIVGAEALLRWMHPVRGLLTPDVFIEVAEDSGLILPIGDWVLRAACAQGARWEQEGIRDLELSVNLSTRQFRQSDLVDRVALACAQAGFSSRNVHIELTESLMMEDMEKGIVTMRALKELGVNICIDDFGIGYSSLSYLKRFPLDTLKIDRSFIEAVPVNAEATAIASTILAMARTLGLSVVAEGVESEPQLEFLRALGCPRFQGFLLARPLPPAELSAMIRRLRAKQPELVPSAPSSAA
jgi:diguanylate cyclase (GGDEF)-like protein/PAS domain S-box-containing protein